MARSLVTVTLPGGGDIAQLWTWSDLGFVDWSEFFAPLAALVPDAEWVCQPIPDDWSDRRALSGH